MLKRRFAGPIAVVGALSALIGGTVLGASSQPIPFATVVKSPFGGTDKPSQRVIESAAEFKAVFLAQPPASIDFSKQVVLAVSMGAQPYSGSSIAITKITGTAAGNAVVHYVERAPGPFAMVYSVVTQPVHIVKIARGPKQFFFRATDPGLADASYALDMKPQGTLLPGKATNFDVKVFEGGTKVTDFASVHGQDMHLILVSQDLTDFQHMHPTLHTGGTFTTNARLNLAQPYAVFVECQPKGYADEEVAQTGLFPVGGNWTQPKLNVSEAFFGSNTRYTFVDHTKVTLKAAPNAKKLVQAGVTAHILIEVRDQTGGAANVQDWLGMPGHAIALSPDLSTFFHLHAARGGSGGMSMPGMGTAPTYGSGSTSPSGHSSMTMSGSSMSGMSGMSSSSTMSSGMTPGMSGMPSAKYLGASSDDLTYDLTLPTAGLYKVFFQFQRNGRVVTAPFVVYASP